MTDEQFQTLLRGSDPRFRRFLIFLKFTGCRFGEAASMRWADVRFDEASVVLREHKTARKTGRPRVIPLVPTVIKLLLRMRSRREAVFAGDQGHVFINGRGNFPERGSQVGMRRWRIRLKAERLTRMRNGFDVLPPGSIGDCQISVKCWIRGKDRKRTANVVHRLAMATTLANQDAQ